jgi:predicted ArsR family transcriptional regulator
MKTIKQIADELGVSKQSIRNQIANLGLQSTLQKKGNQFTINTSQEVMIIKAFKKKSQTENVNQFANKAQSELHYILHLLEQQIVVLNGQLQEKDSQISTLITTLENTTASLKAAQESTRAEQALHAGTMQKQLTDSKEVIPKASGLPKKPKFIEWLRKGRK